MPGDGAWEYVTDVYGNAPWRTDDPLGGWEDLRECFDEPIGDLTWACDGEGEFYRDENGTVVFRKEA